MHCTWTFLPPSASKVPSIEEAVMGNVNDSSDGPISSDITYCGSHIDRYTHRHSHTHDTCPLMWNQHTESLEGFLPFCNADRAYTKWLIPVGIVSGSIMRKPQGISIGIPMVIPMENRMGAPIQIASRSLRRLQWNSNYNSRGISHGNSQGKFPFGILYGGVMQIPIEMCMKTPKG